MSDTLIVGERQLRALVQVDERAVDAIAAAFVAQAAGGVDNPPIMHLALEQYGGDVDIKSAYVQGLDHLAVKIGAGFFENHLLGLPNSPATVVLVNVRTGCVEAVLLENGHLTNTRTAAAGAVAARSLAPAGLSTVGIVGTGVQARYQLEGLKAVVDFERVVIWGRTRASVDAFVAEMAPAVSCVVEAAPDLPTLVQACQLVVTTTPAHEPLIEADWLHDGLHITAVGADLPGKRELGPGVLRSARLFCDSLDQALVGGELQHLGGEADPAEVTELGQVAAGSSPGRRSAQEITVCDLTGMGIEDTAIGVVAYERAVNQAVGTIVPSEAGG